MERFRLRYSSYSLPANLQYEIFDISGHYTKTASYFDTLPTERSEGGSDLKDLEKGTCLQSALVQQGKAILRPAAVLVKFAGVSTKHAALKSSENLRAKQVYLDTDQISKAGARSVSRYTFFALRFLLNRRIGGARKGQCFAPKCEAKRPARRANRSFFISYGSPTESGEAWIISTNLMHRPSAFSAACSQTSSKAADVPWPTPGTLGAPARSFPASPFGPAPVHGTATLGCQSLTWNINRLHELFVHGSLDSFLDSDTVLLNVVRFLALPYEKLSSHTTLIQPATCVAASGEGFLNSVGIKVTGRETICPCGLRQRRRSCSLSFLCLLIPTSSWFCRYVELSQLSFAKGCLRS